MSNDVKADTSETLSPVADDKKKQMNEMKQSKGGGNKIMPLLNVLLPRNVFIYELDQFLSLLG